MRVVGISLAVLELLTDIFGGVLCSVSRKLLDVSQLRVFAIRFGYKSLFVMGANSKLYFILSAVVCTVRARKQRLKTFNG